jgi:two-component system OmpR family sensor kinase
VSLRTRLLIGLLALAAVGLGISGAVTYQYTKRYVLRQVDQQLTTAVSPVARHWGFDAPPEFARRGGRPPLGTYGQLRAADGTIIDTVGGEFGEPVLAPRLEIGRYTAGSPSYRIAVFATPTRGQVVVAVPMRDANETLRHLLTIELLVAAGVLLALAGLAWWVVKLGLRPLERMQDTAGAIAAGDLSRRVDVTDERTEVGRLGTALNEMLHQIERAFAERAASEERLRRFVGDASHELRTPLTSIRGYAELFRRGAAERPEDLEKAMRRIEAEADRMGVMVEDLLLLARLDQGRPLERHPVDLARIAADAVDDTRAIAPDRPIEYTPNGAVVVPGDEVRLRQVFANLLQNAVRHTPPATPVRVAVTAQGPDAVIEIADRGPGMEPQEAERAFERFWRADASRARASGGTGLGLAIVAAIAEAHGGSASVDTAPGRGATFRVRLPRGESGA